MKALFFTISWLESRRIRRRFILMLVIAMLSSIITKNISFVDIDFSFEGQMESGFIQLMPLMPVFAIAVLSQFFLLTILFSCSFRRRDEWDCGQYQVVAMGDHSLMMVEIGRFLFYFLLSMILFLLVWAPIFFYLNKIEYFNEYEWKPISTVLSYWFFVSVPLLISFSLMVGAANLSYFQNGGGKLLTLIVYLGIAAFLLLVNRFFYWIGSTDGWFLPQKIVEVGSIVFRLDSLRLSLSWIFTVFFLLWAGKILEEVES